MLFDVVVFIFVYVRLKELGVCELMVVGGIVYVVIGCGVSRRMVCCNGRGVGVLFSDVMLVICCVGLY